ncbi:MAG TPA: peptidylprolyl isomerase [Streptosporangiaceae bacterium]|nr:peptidylprolyl isomerase [Streptosporangiaceae bacterium]
MAGKKERQRKLARERYQRRLAREEQRRENTRKITKWVSGSLVILVLAGVVILTVIHLTGSSASAQAAGATPSASASASASASPSASPSASQTEPATHCTYISNPPAARNVGVPSATPDSKSTYQATLKTNRGSIVIDLLNSKATCTVNSFVFLAAKNYFNGTYCHRLTTSGIYVLQCGDPTGTGSGGPGYAFGNENLAGATYHTGTVAMANTGAPNSNGSQFFLVYQETSLPPSYTPFGTIVSGLNIIQAVAHAGTANKSQDGPPKDKVVIESVTIKKT